MYAIQIWIWCIKTCKLLRFDSICNQDWERTHCKFAETNIIRLENMVHIYRSDKKIVWRIYTLLHTRISLQNPKKKRTPFTTLEWSTQLDSSYTHNIFAFDLDTWPRISHSLLITNGKKSQKQNNDPSYKRELTGFFLLATFFLMVATHYRSIFISVVAIHNTKLA